MARIKGSLVVRERNALKRLEVAYEKFKATKEDKKPWTSTKNGKTKFHRGRSYADECERMKKEIENIKKNITKNT